MSEYIKRQDALDALRAMAERTPADRIREIPAEDVVPAKHGRFVHVGPRFNGGVDWWNCSECCRLVSGVETQYRYCPGCGAKMDLEE